MTATPKYLPTTDFLLTASATGTRHAAEVTELERSGRSVCGTDAALPFGSTADLNLTAVRLNDEHLDGVHAVCAKCRAAVNVAAIKAGGR